MKIYLSIPAHTGVAFERPLRRESGTAGHSARAFAGLVLAAATLLASSQASADVVNWTSWTSDTSTETAGAAGGTMNLGTTPVTVTVSNTVPFAFTQLGGGGTNYWGPYTCSWPPSPYISSVVGNAPSAPDIISLNGAGTTTITFTDGLGNPISVVNPLIALVSWNGAVVDFGVPIEFLSYGCGYFGTGTPTLNATGTGFTSYNPGVGPQNEVHGVIELVGTYSSFSFTDSVSEFWHGFTVGARAPTTTYSYAGKGFTTFECATSPNPDCPAPGTGNSYTTSDSVTAALTLASALAPNSGPLDVTSLPGFKLTMSDGLNTVTVPGTNSHATAVVMTDSKGNIAAWYLDVSFSDSGVGVFEEIYSIFDNVQGMNGAIGNSSPCGIEVRNCVREIVGGASDNTKGEDYGSEQFCPDDCTPTYYGYNLAAPGSFAQPGTGGIVQVSDCIGTSGKLCNPTGASEFSVAGPGTANLPHGITDTQALCVVPSDPRGANCGASLNPFRLPRQLAVKDIKDSHGNPLCLGFGDEVIPPWLCGASGPSHTGFALSYGVAEQLNAQNGIYLPFKQLINNIPALQSSSNPTCDASPNVRAVAIGGTRSNSLTEEQGPERALDGRPLLTEVSTGCDPDPGPKGSGLPGHSIEGIGFKNLLDEPGPGRVLREVAIANGKYDALNVIAADTDFTSATMSSPIGLNGAKLKACVATSRKLLNQGKYMCAAEQVYRCEKLVDLQGVYNPGVEDYRVFKQAASSPLRLPDLWGDWLRRLGNVFNTVNYVGITAGVPHMAQTIQWPTDVTNPGDPTLLADPYPSSCPLQ